MDVSFCKYIPQVTAVFGLSALAYWHIIRSPLSHTAFCPRPSLPAFTLQASSGSGLPPCSSFLVPTWRCLECDSHRRTRYIYRRLHIYSACLARLSNLLDLRSGSTCGGGGWGTSGDASWDSGASKKKKKEGIITWTLSEIPPSSFTMTKMDFVGSDSLFGTSSSGIYCKCHVQLLL